MNDGNGWMLPEKLRLADYSLGHDDRARERQPVASILGPRFLPWQCDQTAKESWHECELHADLIGRILGAGIPPSLTSELDSAKDPEGSKDPQIRLF